MSDEGCRFIVELEGRVLNPFFILLTDLRSFKGSQERFRGFLWVSGAFPGVTKGFQGCYGGFRMLNGISGCLRRVKNVKKGFNRVRKSFRDISRMF